MSLTYTQTNTTSFTLTHARYLASKIATDLDLCSQYYSSPSPNTIDDYKEELAQLLKNRYVKTYEFGFKKNGVRFVSWHYSVDSNGNIQSGDDRPGKLFSRAKIEGCSYFNFLTPSDAWNSLSQEDRGKIEATLPIKRTCGTAPSDGAGHWQRDKNYQSGGCNLGRKTFIPH